MEKTNERKHVSTLGAHGRSSSVAEFRDYDVSPEHVSMEHRTSLRRFSDVSNPETIRDICVEKVPGWDKFSSAVDRSSIKIHQLCEGLSNQIFKVYVENASANNGAIGVTCVLFRVYGNEVSRLYDPQNELYTYKLLAEYGIAPTCYANDEGWRIEEWHKSIPLLNRIMTNPSVLAQVAAQLGRFHKLPEKQRDFPAEMWNRETNVERRLREWSVGAKEIRSSGYSERRFKILGVDEMIVEAEWLPSFLLSEDSNVRGNGLDKVLSHGDVQENNILQTAYGLRFIDFEYSGMCYQAFDIANYFAECTIDYLHKEYPFYSIDPTNFPSEAEQRLFCAIYLSEYLECKVRLDDEQVDLLLKTVEKFTLASHLIWALWSIVRCPGGGTYCEFDFLEYGQTRYEMYKKAKRDLMRKRGAQRQREPQETGPITTMTAGAGIATACFCVAILAFKYLKA
jgi:thiamine kinase-like enzyme